MKIEPLKHEKKISLAVTQESVLTLAGYPRNDTFHTLNNPKST